MIKNHLEASFKIVLQLLILSSLFATAWYLKFHNLPLLQADSMGYIEFSSSRTIGYPFFLWVVKCIFGTLTVVPIIQLTFVTLATTWLGVEFYQLIQQRTLTFLFVAGLMCNPVYHYIFNILTESLSITLLMSFLAIILSMSQSLSLKKLMCLSFIIGLSILIRPVHYAYLPVFVFIYFVFYPTFKQKMIKWLSAAVLPAFILILLGCWGQYEKNGEFRLESMGGFNMIGKVSLIADTQINSEHPAFLNEVAAYAQSLSIYLGKVPNNRTRYLLSSLYYDYFRYHQLPQIQKHQFVDDQIYMQVSKEIILSRPFAYIKDAWINYCALWQLYDLMTVNERKDFKEFLHKHQPTPYIDHQLNFNQINFSLKNHPLFVWSIRLTLGVIAVSGLIMILSIGASALRRRRLPPVVLTGAIAAATTQSHFALVALSQAGIPRYSFGLWPTIVVVGVITLELIRQKLMSYFNER